MTIRSVLFLSLACSVAAVACSGTAADDAMSAESSVSSRRAEGEACKTSGDCALGAKYCTPDDSGRLVCQAKLDTGYGACGRLGNDIGVGRPCGAASCGGGRGSATTCVTAPELDASFCSRPCATDAECGASAFCGRTSASTARVCIPWNCACGAANETTALVSQALSPAGKTACEVGHRFGDVAGLYPANLAHDPVRPTFYERLYHAPMAIPSAGGQLAADARTAATEGAYVSGVVRLAARLWDEELPADVSPRVEGQPTFEDAVARLAGDGADHRAISADAADLPPALKTELAPVLVAVKAAIDLRNAAIPEDVDLDRWFRAPMGMWAQMREVVSRNDKIDLARAADRAFLLEGLRYDLLARAAVVIAEAIEATSLRSAPAAFAGAYAFDQATPWGRIVIRGSGDDAYLASDAALAGDLLLVVDAGGDDRYEIPVGATQGPNNPVSIAIDLGGADTYTYEKRAGVKGDGRERPVSDAAGRRADLPRMSLSEVRRQGAGTLGVGMLLDFGHGNDVYESLRFSQGSGVLGVGVLYDEAGDDSYLAETVAQGGAQLGLGILIDGAGSDRYHGYSVMQGAAHVKAVGMLVDYEGDDTYWTSPGNSYFSVREGGHDYFYEYGINQGAAWGRRADFPMDGVRGSTYLSGGVGALLDLGGADSYTCGAFCQGMGYWFGTGILWDDGADDDKSHGRMFAGGAGIHFGLGVYHDGGGDDQHHVGADCESLTLGAGDDLSLGWFEDLGGNDRYHGCGRAFGAASEKGVGVFLDHAGDDAYDAKRASVFGWVEDPAAMREPGNGRSALRSTGIFADGAGRDTYARAAHFEPDPVGDARSWTHPWVTTEPAAGSRSALPQPVTYGSPEVCAVGLDR